SESLVQSLALRAFFGGVTYLFSWHASAGSHVRLIRAVGSLVLWAFPSSSSAGLLATSEKEESEKEGDEKAHRLG
ncbi:hypothetical protein PENTCL1PPCAC_9177, partial [Pristionchus entomophagus]